MTDAALPRNGLPEYEVFALRYGYRDGRRPDHFIGGDTHDAPMPMDYFFWVIRGEGRVVVVDCGFNGEVAARRGCTLALTPAEALALLDIDPDVVPDLVLTHLHYDHAGNLDLFPAARLHLQEPELQLSVGRYMKHPFLQAPFEVQDVVRLVYLNYAGRVCLHNGEVKLHPGITLHPAPGHSAALQFVSVNTKRGMIVLASDAAHFYENMETGRPFTVTISTAQSLESYDFMRKVAHSPAHIVPGHDPLVMERYPAPSPALQGVIVRLDVPPSA